MHRSICRFSCCLLISSVLGIASSSQAAIIISLDNKTALPGETVDVGVYATSDSGDDLAGFNLPLDINADGTNPIPAPFSLATPPLHNSLFVNTGYDTPSPQITIAQVDAIPSGFDAAVVLSATPTKLFDLTFVVGPSAVGGTVLPIQIRHDDNFFNITTNGSVLAPALNGVVQGSITVVPEPTGMASLLALLTAGLVRRRFRRS